MDNDSLPVTRSLAEPLSAKSTSRGATVFGRALILTGDQAAAAILPGIIEPLGLQPVSIETLEQLRSYHWTFTISLLLCEEQLPDGTFRDALAALGKPGPSIPVIVFSRIAEWENYLEAMRCGAYDCLRYPFRSGELERIIGQLLEAQRLSGSADGLMTGEI